MNDKTSRRWDEMLEEFRALGGTADNIQLGEGNFGRGLFPIDPSRPIKVHIPESLLVDFKHVEFANDAFRVGPEATIGEREKRFLEAYEQDFSWGASRHDTQNLLQMMHDAPEELRDKLRKFCLWWLAGPTPEAIQERFFGSRTIARNGRDVVMPIVELANHGDAAGYDFRNGIGLSGEFAGEVLVRYRLTDPWRIFANWGFPSTSEFIALSMGMTREEFVIENEEIEVINPARPFFPKVSSDGPQLKLSYLMLGNRKNPRFARGIFRRIMQDAGRPDADEVFDRILHVNRTEFFDLLEASELAAPPLGRLLRTVILLQLRAISHCIGSRPV